MKAIETTGVIDAQCELHLDQPLAGAATGPVRVIVLVPEDGDIPEPAWLAAGARSPAFDFLCEPAEDIYTLADGKPFHD